MSTVARGDMMRFQDQSFVRSVSAKPSQFNTAFGIFMLLTLVSLSVWGVYSLSRPETLPIKQVRIVGEFRHLSPSRLQTLVTEEVRGGFFNVNVTEVRNELLKAPWVEHISVNRIWPDTLRVNVKERVAVVRWGDKALLNSDATYFVPPAATIPRDLPLLNGPQGSYELVLSKFNELNQVLKHTGLKVVELTLNERRAWSFTVQTGFTVVIGRMDYEQRVRRFSEVVVKAMVGQLDKVEKIDMRYTNGFAIEWRKGDSV